MKKMRTTLAVVALLLLLISTACDFLPPLPTFPQPTITRIPADLTDAANRILPSTVIIDTPFSTGTGWILQDGIIATNYHVIEGARIIMVTLHDGQRFSVRTRDVAADPVGDLAIIRVNTGGLPEATIGSSAFIKVGDPVVAVGNSYGEGISVKSGRITRLNMTVAIEDEIYYGLIEDNASIQEGDSGGPLVNSSGEVIGISNAKVIGLEDIAYAIDIDSAMPLFQELIEKGMVSRGYLGISGIDNPDGDGVLVEEVVPGGPADEAGLEVGDVILAVDATSMDSIESLRNSIRSLPAGQRVTITLHRGDSRFDILATLAQLPL
jgi:serine protease Do